jgi:hypothetical protein
MLVYLFTLFAKPTILFDIAPVYMQYFEFLKEGGRYMI